MALKIIICDLTHVGARIAMETFPLGSGFIYSYSQRTFGDRVALHLIKYPEELDEVLAEGCPHIVAFANYVWNNELNEHYCRHIKTLYPNAIIVKGGPNFPVNSDDKAAYLLRHSSTDAYIEFEGELAFANLVRAVLERGAGWNTEPVAGVYFLDRQANGSSRLVCGGPVPRITDLDAAVPSPYQTGVLDKFFDGKLTPIIQRTRGCPFTCNFCNEGVSYYNKINTFSVERIVADLRYIAPRAERTGVRHLIITDMNFGMYDEDLLIAREIARCKAEFGWPLTVSASTGKNRIDRVSRAVEALGDSIIVSMSMQSTSEPVLAAIRRKNIKPEMYVSLTSQMPNQPKMAELIVPLPEESLASYQDSVRFLINAGVDKVLTYTLQINLGTEYDSHQYLTDKGYDVRYRAYANCFGQYHGETVMEAETVGVATNTLSFEDYLQIRKLAFIVELVFNNSIFGEIFRLLSDYEVAPFDFVYACFEGSDAPSSSIRSAVEAFIEETQAELFASPEALFGHFRDASAYRRLVDGEEGRNVLFSNKAQVMATQLDALVEFVSACLARLVRARGMNVPADQVENVVRYSRAKLHDVLDPDAALDESDLFQFDIPAWVQTPGSPLEEYRNPEGVCLSFFFDESQIAERRDAFLRYGRDVAGAMKIFARIANHQRLVRCVRRVPLANAPVE